MSLSVSVALCTYNGAQFVEQQLRSIVNQTVSPTEVVIADDGSTDDTLDRVHAICAETDVPVRILTGSAPLGVTLNFQRAIEACSGDLIALSDQDDIWHPDRLALSIPAFASDPGLLFQHTDARLVGEGGELLGPTLFEALSVSRDDRVLIAEGRGFEVYLRRNLATGATVVFRRTLLAAALPFPMEWVHDEWLAIIAAAVGRVQLSDAQPVDYRQHGNNQIGVQKPTIRYRVGRMLQPRGSRYAELALRSEVLVGRLQALTVEPSLVERALKKARFESVRAGLPIRRVARLRTVIREYRKGSYRALSSQGNLDTVRDLLQSA